MTAETEACANSPRWITDLDSNQRRTAERILDRLTISTANPRMDELVQEAIEAAQEIAPTAKSAAEEIASLRNGPAYCYLAFFGVAGVASYLKIGMSRHPEKRLYDMGVGNPLDCLWVFAAQLPTSKCAYAVEHALHRHMEGRHQRGEWFSIGETGVGDAAALARQLEVVAQESDHRTGSFVRLGADDGR